MEKELTRFLIEENIPVLDALKKINASGARTVFCVERNKLIGVLTDSDVRRWIINGGALDALVRDAMNHNPVYLKEEESDQAKYIIQKRNIDAIPIIDEKRHIINVYTWADFQNPKEYGKINVPVVMMAGGKGTRLYPYTKILPKPLIPMGEVPIAEHIINQFCEYGCVHFFLIVNHKKNMIKAYFNEIDKNYDIVFMEESIPLGTGGGLGLLKGVLHETFILTNCDILIEEDFSRIFKYHKEHKNIITMICATQNVQIPYGVVNFDENGQIKSMEEKPNINYCTNTGCYVVEPEVIDNLEKDVSIGFPDIIEKYLKEGCNVGVYRIDENEWLDMGQMEGLEKMQKRLRV